VGKCPYNPFDLTKVWLEKDYPLIEVGVLELNKNPEIILFQPAGSGNAARFFSKSSSFLA